MLSQISYRVAQLRQALHPEPLTTGEWTVVAAILNESEMTLFQQLPLQDQRHSFNVLNTLQAAGYENGALCKAGLLHDVGKTKAPPSNVERVLVVLGSRFLPQRMMTMTNEEAQGWARPFVVKLKHPEWGADMALAAGSDTLTAALIRRHQEPAAAAGTDEEERLLRALQWADNQN